MIEKVTCSLESEHFLTLQEGRQPECQNAQAKAKPLRSLGSQHGPLRFLASPLPRSTWATAAAISGVGNTGIALHSSLWDSAGPTAPFLAC